MAPWWAVPVLGAGLSAVGDFLGASSAQSFSERMANTQWQRGVADMRAAGLNPALAFSQGPAAAPQGVVPQFGSRPSEAIGSALQAKRLDAEIGLMRDQGHKVDAERQLALEHGHKTRLESEVIENQLPRLRTWRRFDESFRGRNAATIGRFVQSFLRGN